MKYSILLIDSYDSFTYNLYNLISRSIENCSITTIHNDINLNPLQLKELINSFDGVIIGPGPGSPCNNNDIGIIPQVWKLGEELKVPIFGVCLGMQTLCNYYGYKILVLDKVKHGIKSEIIHNDNDIFNSIPNKFLAVRYHSLYVENENFFAPENEKNNNIELLAYTIDGMNKIPMGVKHKLLPFWGVQFHPESICSLYGEEIIKNFWNLSDKWIKERKSSLLINLPKQIYEKNDTRYEPLTLKKNLNNTDEFKQKNVKFIEIDYTKYDDINIIDLSESIKTKGSKVLLLESAAAPGKWNILGLKDNSTTEISYTIGLNSIKIKENDDIHSEKIKDKNSIWEFIANFMKRQGRFVNGPSDCQFWGGFIGYLSYETGVKELEIDLARESLSSPFKIPDVDLYFIRHSVLFNSELKKLYILTLLDNDEKWLQSINSKISNQLLHKGSQIKDGNENENKTNINCLVLSSCFISKELYKEKFMECQKNLHSGDSYELCLTTQAKIKTSKLKSWDLYKILRKSNPAPYASFLEFSHCTIIGSSPERFMSWNANGVCEFRPIKGTVKKAKNVDFEVAKSILGSDKEQAENLMIVDLIRHDLYRLMDKVNVFKLMTIEEYHTVFQLVSVIQGEIKAPYSGIDVLIRSLPPGSMTGAPKKRSVELLQQIEGHERGIYSGVLGYWSVNDNADWSVVIRTAVRYNYDNEENEDDSNMNNSDTWTIGAGGAITALSNWEDEYEEMNTKFNSVCNAITGDKK